MRSHVLILTLAIFSSSPVFSFQDSSAVCDGYHALPLSQLPPLMGANSVSRGLQAEYVRYLDHLRSGAKPESFRSEFAAQQIRELLNDQEQMRQLRIETHGDNDDLMVMRLRELLLSGTEGTRDKINFSLLISDLIQRGEKIFDHINEFQLGKEPRYDENAKVRLGLLLGHTFKKNDFDTRERTPYHIAREIVSHDLMMINTIKESRGEKPIKLSPNSVSIDPRERRKLFGDETYISSLASSFLSQILLEEPLLRKIEFGGGGAVGIAFDQAPILLTPYNGVIDDETWASLSVWPVFPMTKDVSKPDKKLTWFMVPQTTFVGTKRGSVNAMAANWNWFNDVYPDRAKDAGKIRLYTSQELQAESRRLADSLEQQIRSRYMCSCRVIGQPPPPMQAGVAKIWHRLAYYGQDSLKKPLNSPYHIANALKQMPFDKHDSSLLPAREYLLARLAQLSDDCQSVREERDENRQRQSLTQRVANEALKSLKQLMRQEEVAVSAGARPKQNEEKKEDDQDDLPELAPWRMPPGSKPTAGNDNVADGVRAAAFVAVLAPALVLHQDGAMLEKIRAALTAIEEHGSKEVVLAGVGVTAAGVATAPHVKQAIRSAQTIAKGLMLKHPSPSKMASVGLRRAMGALGVVSLLAETTVVGHAEALLDEARASKSYAYHFTLEGLKADAKAGRLSQLAKSDPLLKAFYQQLAFLIESENKA